MARPWLTLLAGLSLLISFARPSPTAPPRGRHSPRRAGRPRRRRHQDGGNILVFEAVVIAMMLLTAIAVAMTRPGPSPTPSINPARGPLENQVKDLLVAMEDIPTSDRYQNLMQRAIAKAVQGNTTAFENLIDRAMPPGTECRLWLNNGHKARLLTGPSERLARESVSRSVLWQPSWAYGFVLPTLDLVSEVQPLPLQGYQVSQGSLVREHGVPIAATLLTDQNTYERAALTSIRAGPTANLTLLDENGQPGFVYTDPVLQWVTTPLVAKNTTGTLGNGTFTVPIDQRFLNITAYANGAPPLGLPLFTNVTLVDPTGANHILLIVEPSPVPAVLSIASPSQGNWTYTTNDQHPLTYGQLHINASSIEGNQNWSFTLREEGSGNLPEGTKLSLTFPSVFTAVESTRANQSGWRNITPTNNLDTGALVTAELDSALTGGQRVLMVNARRPATGDALYAVAASLSQGAEGKANFILGSPEGTTSTNNPLDHELYLSLPKPQATSTSTTWGIAFAYPKTTAGAEESLIALDLKVADDTPLFAGAVGLSPATGWMLVSPTHLRWNGTLPLLPNKALDFIVNVTTVAQRTPSEPSLGMPVQFQGNTAAGVPNAPAYANFSLMDQERPYVQALNVPAAKDLLGNAQKGYHRPAGVPTERVNATVNATGIVRGMLASGSATYGVTAWGGVTTLAEATRIGMGKSHLNVSRSTVKLGESTELNIDFQGLFDEVSLAGMPMTAWNVEVKVFDPAQPFAPFAEMLPSLHGKYGADANLTYKDVEPELDSIVPWVTSKVDVFTRAKATVAVDVPRDSFYGPHAVVVQANFLVKDLVSGESMAQSARVLGVINVVPDSGQNVTALYWATLECWLMDW